LNRFSKLTESLDELSHIKMLIDDILLCRIPIQKACTELSKLSFGQYIVFIHLANKTSRSITHKIMNELRENNSYPILDLYLKQFRENKELVKQALADTSNLTHVIVTLDIATGF
jgi:hypothetical protein